MAVRDDAVPRQGPAPTSTTLERLTAMVIVGILAMALGLVALAMPTHAIEKRNLDYRQSGEFSYSATAPANSPYGPSGMSVGEPILLDVVGPVTVSFEYRLTGPDAAGLAGTASLDATVGLSQGLSRTFPIAEEKTFTGDRVTVSGTLPVKEVQRYLADARASFGDTGFSSSSGSTLTVHPTIKVRGTLGRHVLKAAFAPELPFVLNGQTLLIDQSQDAGLGDQAAAADPLTPAEPGKLGYRASSINTVPLPFLHPSVALARILGFGIALLCLILGAWLARPLWRSGPESERRRIQTLYGSRIVEVEELGPSRGPVAALASMDALADVAKRYESVIMHLTDAHGDAYLVWDDGLLYQYRPTAAERQKPTALASEPPQPVRNG